MAAHSSKTPDDTVPRLRHQLKLSEERIFQLQKEKDHMHADFESKRSKIKELYYAKENVIRDQNKKLLTAGEHISELESTISDLREEIDNIKMIASVSENTKMEAVEDLNKHHHEEIESLRCVLQDSMEEQRRDLIVQFEQERRHWEQEKDKLEMELEESRERLLEAESLVKAKHEKNSVLKDQDLDLGMMKAQVEADQLKAVVVPLETEIAELKEKLKSTEENLEIEKKKTEQALKDKTDLQNRVESLQNEIDKHSKDTTTSVAGSVATHTEDSTDDESFEPFQRYSRNSDKKLPTIPSISTTSTDFQDSISVMSVASIPPSSSKVTLNDEMTTTSPGDLNSIDQENKTPKQSEGPRAWDEVPGPSSKPSLSKTEEEYEKEINDLQQECSNLREETLKLKKQIEKERKMRFDVEESVTHASEEAQKQIKQLSGKLSELESKLVEEKSWRRQKETEDDKRLAHLQKDREQIYKQLLQLKSENDFIRSSFEKHRMNVATNSIVPHTAEELKSELRRCRESLIATQVEKSHLESRLQSQLAFLQDRLNAEMVAKEQIEITFQMELEDARKQLNSLHEIRQKLDREVAEKQDLQSRFEKDQLSIESIRTKSKEIIKGLKEKLKNETSSKEELESRLSSSKNQVRSLQEALETSEQVQQDFVRLSQSLQMKLEDIRTKEELLKTSSATSHGESQSDYHPSPHPGPG